MPDKPRVARFQGVTMLLWFSLYAYVPMLANYARDLGAGLSQTGVILGSYGFMQTILRVPLGICSDTIGKRRIFVTLGFGVSLISALVMYFAPSPAFLLVGRGLAGVTAATWVVATVLYTSYFEVGNTTRPMSMLNVFNHSGQVIAMLLGSWAVQLFFPRAMFLVSALGAVAGLLLSLGVTESAPRQKRRMRPGDFLVVLKDRTLLTVSVMALLLQMNMMGTLSGFTPQLATDRFGATSLQLGMLSMLATAMAGAGAFISASSLPARMREPRYIALAALLLAGMTALIPYSPSLPLLFAAQALAGLMSGACFSLLMGLSIRNIEPDKRATAMGVFQAVYGVGMFLGPVIVGLAGDAYGLSAGYWVVGGMCLLLIPLSCLMLPGKARGA